MVSGTTPHTETRRALRGRLHTRQQRNGLNDIHLTHQRRNLFDGNHVEGLHTHRHD